MLDKNTVGSIIPVRTLILLLLEATAQKISLVAQSRSGI